MKRPIIKQIVKAVLYYVIGFFVTWLVYKLSGTPYAHGPNFFHLVGLLVLFGGFIWAIKAAASLDTRDKQVGTLMVHALVVGSLIVTFIFQIRSETDFDATSNPESIITINRDSAPNNASVINGADETLFLKKGDSVLIDKIGTDSNKNDYR